MFPRIIKESWLNQNCNASKQRCNNIFKYLGFCEASKKELFEENGWWFLAVLSIISKKLYYRCFQGFKYAWDTIMINLFNTTKNILDTTGLFL